jgi:ribosomal protein S18 acetylase RimI-like enzyme
MALFCSAQEFDSLCSDVANKADRIRLQVKGGSMYPFIQSGDWVELALFRSGEGAAEKGDVILLRKDGNLLMHRVLKKVQDGFIVKGDMSLGPDGQIPADDIIARVVSTERNAQRVDLRSKTNRFISIAIADTSLIVQYPVLVGRKISALAVAVFTGIQGLPIYRALAKKALKTEVVIREACPDDAEAIRDLFIMGGHDVKKDIIDIKKEGFWLAAERKRKIVAALTVTRFEKDPKLWVIFGLEVKPAFRGLGIGERMVREAVVKARDGGAKNVGLFVNKRSTPAIKMYKKIGFKESSDFPSDFNRSPNELYLSYAIDS